MSSDKIPATQTRVQESTSEHVNERIRRQTEENIRHYANHPSEINQRLEDLEKEWDIERLLEMNMSIIALTGLALSLWIYEWVILSAIVLIFFLQHAIQGWCPPVPIFRRWGYRTTKEIYLEKYALKAIRGDFREVDATVASADIASRATDAAGK